MLVPVLGGLFAAIGAALALLAVRQGRRQQAFRAASVRTSGTVVGLVQTPTPTADLGRSTFPRVSFRTAGGREITFESRLGSEHPTWRVGQELPVRFRPDRPHEAEIDTFFALWGPAVVLGGLGAVFLGVGLGLLSGAIPA